MRIDNLIKAMVDSKKASVYAVHNNITSISRGNGKKKSSKITVAIQDDDVDLFFGITSTLAKPNEQGIAFMVLLDKQTVDEIVENDKKND